MNKFKQNKQQKITNFIKSRYNEKSKVLRLNFASKQWVQVLLHDNWKMLNQLYLECCCISSKKMKIISDIDLCNLKGIYLSRNQIGTKGAKYLSKINFSFLQILQINDNLLGDRGIVHLYKANWPNLSSISIYNNKIILDGCIANNLTNSYNQKQLIANKHCFGLMQTNSSNPIAVLALIVCSSRKICINSTMDNQYLRVEVARILKIHTNN